MIRTTAPADTPTLVDMTRQTNVFKPHEIQALQEVLDDYHTANQAEGHRAITFVDQRQILGFAYYAPVAMTEGTWYLYWIVVKKDTQARGIGAALLRHLEEDIRTLSGRVLFIETSALPHYEMTRKFYVKHHYDKEAVLRDFYAAGDDMVVFRKVL